MNVCVLHTRLSGYFISCLKALAEAECSVSVYHYPRSADAPYSQLEHSDAIKLFEKAHPTTTDTLQLLHQSVPDAILLNGWSNTAYIQAIKEYRREHKVPVVAICDTQWRGSLRQRLASLTAYWHLHSFLDVLWVTGERQRVLARALGYDASHSLEGAYACDWNIFASLGRNREQPHEPFFLYVGRYAPEKGLSTLIKAYRLYRKTNDNPWPLVTAGAGPLAAMLKEEGIDDQGFLQPSQLPTLMSKAASFVLPSHYEPWGVVLHEATAAGLPCISTEAVGASVHLLRNHHNGYTVQAQSVEGLRRAMQRMHELNKPEWESMSRASHSLSKQYTPKLWAQTFRECIQSLSAKV